MEVTENTLDDIRKDLEKSGAGERELTSKEIVLALAPDIHKQMLAGAKLMSLYEIVRAKLPEETKLSKSTFKKYWRIARDELKLKPIKASGPKGPRKPVAKPQQNANHEDRKTRAVDTSSDFRTDPEDI
ncbi:hypothetical protein [Roseovarius nanhaiticus]|uniref:hypothetical protein n=1 Tax=Roseovarius nanhaiticus TaxID=573024 RepID=UPI00248F8F71|nr:hypothetical protein [Roseovarius nanhaiticus]